MEKENGKFSAWAVIELFGHSQIAGEVTEYTIGSSTWIRVTVPETRIQKSFDRMLHPNAIYAINPVTEDVARMRAEKLEVTPISAWDLPDPISEALRQYNRALRQENEA